MIPPVLVRLHVGRLRLWLPVILLWPLWGLIFILGIVVAPLFLVFRRGRRWLRVGIAGCRMLCALRGLEVQVRHGQDGVRIKVV